MGKISKFKNKKINTSRYYYNSDIDIHIEKYFSITDENEKRKYFEKYLYQPFYKLAEGVIEKNWFKIPTYSKEELIMDCVTKLYMELQKFDIVSKSKSYSFFTRTVYTYLLQIYNETRKHDTVDYHQLIIGEQCCNLYNDEFEVDQFPQHAYKSNIPNILQISDDFDNVIEIQQKIFDEFIIDKMLSSEKIKKLQHQYKQNDISDDDKNVLEYNLILKALELLIHGSKIANLQHQHNITILISHMTGINTKSVKKILIKIYHELREKYKESKFNIEEKISDE